MKIIEIDNVTMAWGRRRVLDGVSLTVNAGDVIVITGPNGGGKTTLLRIMLRLLKPLSGKVTYFNADGKPVDRLPIGYLPQKKQIDPRFPITVEETVASGLLATPLPAAERRRRVDAALATLGLVEKAADSIGELSGGQLQRTLMARALVSDPGVIVLDEPLSYLDARNSGRVFDIVSGLAAQGRTVVIVTHQPESFAPVATRRLFVDSRISDIH